MWLVKGILALVVAMCICISALFAFEFGFGKGVTPIHQWAFGLAGGGLDLLKAALPIMAGAAYTTHQKGRGRLCWAAFSLLTCMSLWCAFGTTAGQLAERITQKTIATTDRAQRQATLTRLQGERNRLPAFRPTSASMVEAAQQEVSGAVDQARAECGDGRGGRGPNCRLREQDERDARAKLSEIEGQKALTDQAADLDGKISEAESALAKVDIRTAEKDADPQAASLSKATGWGEAGIALFSHALFAIGIEVGSGLGLWLIFGHGGKREEHIAATAPAAPPAPIRMGPSAEDVRAEFFRTRVFPNPNDRVLAKDMHAAYVAYCAENGAVPMNAVAFGQKSPWTKRNRGKDGTCYLDCSLAQASVVKPELKVVGGTDTA